MEGHPGDAPVTRGEINRIWAKLEILELLVASDIAARSTDARIRAWHDRISARIDDGSTTSELGRENWSRALDDLANLLLAGIPRPPARPA